jgi:hypothetical protein
VDSRLYFQAQPADRLSHGPKALNRSRWRVEGGKKTVTRRLHFSPFEVRELLSNDSMMLVEKFRPMFVAETNCVAG